MGGRSAGIFEGEGGQEIERDGECKSRMDGQEQMETPCRSIPSESFPGETSE